MDQKWPECCYFVDLTHSKFDLMWWERCNLGFFVIRCFASLCMRCMQLCMCTCMYLWEWVSGCLSDPIRRNNSIDRSWSISQAHTLFHFTLDFMPIEKRIQDIASTFVIFICLFVGSTFFASLPTFFGSRISAISVCQTFELLFCRLFSILSCTCDSKIVLCMDKCVRSISNVIVSVKIE